MWPTRRTETQQRENETPAVANSSGSSRRRDEPISAEPLSTAGADSNTTQQPAPSQDDNVAVLEVPSQPTTGIWDESMISLKMPDVDDDFDDVHQTRRTSDARSRRSGREPAYAFAPEPPAALHVPSEPTGRVWDQSMISFKAQDVDVDVDELGVEPFPYVSPRTSTSKSQGNGSVARRQSTTTRDSASVISPTTQQTASAARVSRDDGPVLMTEPEELAISKRKGLCVGCGIQTHKAHFRFGRVPLTNDNVYQGCCIRCSTSSPQQQASTAVPQAVYEAWERRNPRLAALRRRNEEEEQTGTRHVEPSKPPSTSTDKKAQRSVKVTVIKASPDEDLGLTLIQDRLDDVYIRAIAPSSAFADSSLKPGMRIKSVNGVPAKSSEQAGGMMKSAKDVVTVEASEYLVSATAATVVLAPAPTKVPQRGALARAIEPETKGESERKMIGGRFKGKKHASRTHEQGSPKEGFGGALRRRLGGVFRRGGKKNKDKAAPPQWCYCPISSTIMNDPVNLHASCSHTFNRDAAQAWLAAGNKTCPVCSAPVHSTMLTSDTASKDAIEAVAGMKEPTASKQQQQSGRGNKAEVAKVPPAARPGGGSGEDELNDGRDSPTRQRHPLQSGRNHSTIVPHAPPADVIAGSQEEIDVDNVDDVLVERVPLSNPLGTARPPPNRTQETQSEGRGADEFAELATETNPKRNHSRHLMPGAQQPIEQTELRDDKRLCLLGVSVHYLKTKFMDEVHARGYNENSKIFEIEDLQDSSGGIIRQKGASVECPVDGRIGAAYVHCLEGEDNVGVANFMLSYSWGYCIGDIVQTLDSFCKQRNQDPKRTYIWICCLCVNQHRVAEQSQLERSGIYAPCKKSFLLEFGERVKSIGHLLAMMAPWKSPLYLSRVWCVFELYTAIKNGCETTIVMPPLEKHALTEDLIGTELTGIRSLYEALANTKVQFAQASVEKDRQAILAMIRQSPGYDVLNSCVNDLLRAWIRGVLGEAVQNYTSPSIEGRADFNNTIGLLLNENGEWEESLAMFEKALKIHEVLHGPMHQKTAESLNNIGSVLSSKGDFTVALEKHKRALDIQRSLLLHAASATSYNNIGSVLQKQGDNDGALTHYQTAFAIISSEFGPNHTKTASCYNNLGVVYAAKGNHIDALEAYRKALTILESSSTVGKNHPLVATTHSNIGSVLQSQGDLNGALLEHRTAFATFDTLLGKDHPSTTKSLMTIENLVGSLRAGQSSRGTPQPASLPRRH